MTTFKKIKEIVTKIPRGKVTTYGAIAKLLGLKNSQIVGWALHQNKNPKIPCHRVIFKNGSLATNYTFGGLKIQKEKLKKEGIEFLKENLVNLKRHFW